MTELVITRGLPASGKTTWALEWIRSGEQRARANRDDLRMALFGKAWGLTYQEENYVTIAQHQAIKDLLDRGYSVVVDDTNLRAKVSRALADIASLAGVDFAVQDFTHVPLEECLRRDKIRHGSGGRYVGVEPITSMHERYLASGPLPPVRPTERTNTLGDLYVPTPGRPKAWIVDIDGTLAQMSPDRKPYDFHLVHLDTPIEATYAVCRALYNYGRELIVMSGRDESCRDETEQWLEKHHLPYYELHMRPAGDLRKDAIVKRELFDAHVRDTWHVEGVLDDRDQVVELWRSMGLPTHQVNYGAF